MTAQDPGPSFYELLNVTASATTQEIHAAYLQAVAGNLVSAGLRLIPLGQTDGQRVLAALEIVIAGTAARALACPLDEIGSAVFRADIASMRHETQYTRLFRS